MTSFRFHSVPRRTQRRPQKENLILRKQVYYLDVQGEGEGGGGKAAQPFLGPGGELRSGPWIRSTETVAKVNFLRWEAFSSNPEPSS